MVLVFYDGFNPFKMKPNRFEMSYFAGYKVYFYIVLFFCCCKICICIFFSFISYMELIYHTSTTNCSYRQTKLMTYKLITQSLYSQILDVPLNMSIHLPSLPLSVIDFCFVYACRYSGVVRIRISFDYPSSLITYIILIDNVVKQGGGGLSPILLVYTWIN